MGPSLGGLAPWGIAPPPLDVVDSGDLLLCSHSQMPETLPAEPHAAFDGTPVEARSQTRPQPVASLPVPPPQARRAPLVVEDVTRMRDIHSAR